MNLKQLEVANLDLEEETVTRVSLGHQDRRDHQGKQDFVGLRD